MDNFFLLSRGINEIATLNKFIDFFTINSYENIKRIIAAVIIFFFFLMLRKIFTKYIFEIIVKLTSKTKTEIQKKICIAFEKPIRSLFVVLGVYFSLIALGSHFGVNKAFIEKFLRSIITIFISWGFYNLTGECSVLSDEMKEKLGLKVDNILFPFISKCVRAIIIALAITIVLSEWNINIQMFVTGLGLGGLAFSLAAKDAASNIIAGIVIILEKPFTIGDWVATADIEGVVEDISFRSTRLRTFTQEMVTVPNSNLANVPITNYAKREKRRVNFNIGVVYETSKLKIKSCVDKIRDMLNEHPDIHGDGVVVSFDKFNTSSLDIVIYYFTKSTGLDEHLRVKEDINFRIMDILEAEGVSIAFPSTNVYFKNHINQHNQEEPMGKESIKKELKGEDLMEKDTEEDSNYSDIS